MHIEKRIPTVSEYTKLRSLVGWWKAEEKATKTALKNSLFSVIALENNIVIGIGRIIGDGGLYFYIQDLIIHPKFQNQGIGKALMKELNNYIKSNTKSGAFVGLMAAKGLEEYYKAFGFNKRDDAAPGMYQIIK